MLVVVNLIALVLAASFAMPVWLGFPLLTIVSVVVLPPTVLVGAFQTRGAKQAFFLGIVAGGALHYIISIYYAFMVVIALADSGWAEVFSDAEGLTYFHPVGYILGLVSGAAGVIAHRFLTSDQNTANPVDEPSNSSAEDATFDEVK